MEVIPAETIYDQNVTPFAYATPVDASTGDVLYRVEGGAWDEEARQRRINDGARKFWRRLRITGITKAYENSDV